MEEPEVRERTPITAKLHVPEPRIVLNGDFGNQNYKWNDFPMSIDEAIELYNALDRALKDEIGNLED